jgi:hypothetical protein
MDALICFAADSLGDALVGTQDAVCVSDKESELGRVESGMVPCVPRPIPDGTQPVSFLALDGANMDEICGCG